MNESFYTGKGIGVAILDTGIYPHIDFDSRICAFADFIAHKKVPYDDNGHGTCVAGILAGSGRASMGKYKGMAPGSRIAALKVLDRFGNGNKEDVLQAFRWILQNRNDTSFELLIFLWERLIAHETSRMYWCRVWRNYGMKAWWWLRRQEIRDQSRGA